MAEVNEMMQSKLSGAVPIWASVLIVAGCTLAAFWLFGGQHYLANQSTIEYTIFHHAEDATDPLAWFSWLIQTGTLGAMAVFLLSATCITIFNKRAKSRPEPVDQ
jgi:hypothetical protein